MMNFINKKLTYEELIYKEFSVKSVKSCITIIFVNIRSKTKDDTDINILIIETETQAHEK